MLLPLVICSSSRRRDLLLSSFFLLFPRGPNTPTHQIRTLRNQMMATSQSAEEDVNIPIRSQDVEGEEEKTGSSDEDTNDELFIPFNERSEWDDIQPLPQEGSNPVAAIQYTDRFRNTFDYFRAILAKDERSDRAFHLTSECIHLNPANYTVWYFRRVLLKELEMDLSYELDFMDDTISRHSKNYQVWHHRKCLVEMMQDASREKKFTREILQTDAKNYHAWQHRQWVVLTFKDWEGELEYTDLLIREDVRNNSAWNHRYFVIKNTSGWSDDVIDAEVDYSLNMIKLAPNNESSWNYLRGILQDKGLNSRPRVVLFCEEMLAKPPSPRVSPHLVSFMIDALEENLEASSADGGDSKGSDEQLAQALSLCDLLAKEWDPIRVNYWNFVGDSLKDKFDSSH